MYHACSGSGGGGSSQSPAGPSSGAIPRGRQGRRHSVQVNNNNNNKIQMPAMYYYQGLQPLEGHGQAQTGRGQWGQGPGAFQGEDVGGKKEGAEENESEAEIE